MTSGFKKRSASRKPSLTGTAAPNAMTSMLKCKASGLALSKRKDVEKLYNTNCENGFFLNWLNYNTRIC